MWWKIKPRSFLSDSLRALRAQVIRDGDTFFRVIDSSGNHTDYEVGPDGGYDTLKTARKAAFDHALDLASFDVGSSVFVSERRKLDGVQVCVNCFEVSWQFLEGVKNV